MIHFDPFEAEHRDDPYPAYARLRSESPVHRIEKRNAFAVSRYDDVAFVLRRVELFSSSAMMRVLQSGFSTGVSPLGTGLKPDEAMRLAEMIRTLPINPMAAMTARSLIASDPPVHGPMRSLVNRGFTPRKIAALEPRVRAIAREALDAVEEKGEIELIHDFAIPLPVRVIAELLGVEPERADDFKRWSDTSVASSTGAAVGYTPEMLLRSFSELSTYMIGVIEERRRAPKDDLITTLTRAESGETALTPTEVVMFTLLLLVAGNETTTNLLGNTMLALLANPDQLALVQREPARIPALVEEALRYDGPIQFLVREALQDTEIGGTKIPKGAVVMPLLGSANRDEKQFPNGERFDVTRAPQGHLGFGFGNHFCLGASLARLETRVALEELLARFSRFERLEDRVEYIDSFLIRGLRRLRLGTVRN
jgi:cytochrome P450